MLTIKRGDDIQLDPVTEALLADLDATSDEELLAELEADGLDPIAEAGATADLVARALAQHGKALMQRARQELDAARQGRSASCVVQLPLPKKREILAAFAARETDLKGKLTMAARNGGAGSLGEAEIDSLLSNLHELGLLDDSGKPA